MTKEQLIPFDPCKHLNTKELKDILIRLHNYNAHLRYKDQEENPDNWDIADDVDHLMVKIRWYIEDCVQGRRNPDLDDAINEQIKEFNLEHDFQILGGK